MREEARLISYAGMLLGVVAFVLGWHADKDSAMQAGGAVVVGSLALFGGVAGLTTWRDERRKALEQQQREVYGTLVFQLLSRFAGPEAYDPQVEARVRALAATWADVGVVQAIQAWNHAYSKHVPLDLPNNVAFALTAEAGVELRTATAAVARAVRRELSPGDSATVEEITEALFNLPSSPTPASTG